METRDKQARWLFIKAETNSEWDSVSFAAIQLDDDTKALISRWVHEALKFKSDPRFYKLSCFMEVDGWYVNETISRSFWDAYYVLCNEPDFSGMDKPTQRVSYGEIQLYANGSFRFVGKGEYTGQEFWTEEVPVTIL